MLATDHKNSVFCELGQAGRQHFAFSPYGEGAVGGTMGYNGELCEKLTRWYLLGNGTRAYSPCLMRFQSPDELSPFGAGGVNSYTYCGGNPIDFVDPTGNVFGWFSKIGSWVSKRFSGGRTSTQNSSPVNLVQEPTDPGSFNSLQNAIDGPFRNMGIDNLPEWKAIWGGEQKLGGSQTPSSQGVRSSARPCLLYTSPSPRDRTRSRMPSSA